MPRKPDTNRPEKIISLLKERPRSVNELAEALGCSTKTIQRSINALKKDGYVFGKEKKQIKLVQEVSRQNEPPKGVTGGPEQILRLFSILSLVYEYGNITGDKLANLLVLSTDEKFMDITVTEKTLNNDLALLMQNGYIKKDEEKDSFYPGDTLLPRISLTGEEIEFLCFLIKEYGELSPYRVVLSNVLGKLIASSYYKGEVWESELLKKRLQRILIHRQNFQEDRKIDFMRGEIETAIEADRRVDLLYGSEYGNATYRTASPLCICYNRSNDSWYLFVLPVDKHGNPGVLRMDFIHEVRHRKETFKVPARFNAEACMEPTWGVPSGRPVRVKVKFKDVYNNREKVEALVSNNRSQAKLADVNGYFIYEDEVSGIDEFHRWLRRFGQYAEVLEPESLRNKFLSTAERMLELYGIN